MIAFGMKEKPKDLKMENLMETNLVVVLAESREIPMVLKMELMRAIERAWK